MPEAEELFVDAARHAASAVQGVWQRRRAPAHRPGLRLADQRVRLALLIEAALGRAWPVRSASLPAPTPLLRRLFRPSDGAAAPDRVLPASDGHSVHLPPELPPAPTAAPDLYALLAVLQALRCERGSAALHPAGDALAADLYLLAECVAVDRALRDLLPGWRQALDTLHAAMLRDLDPGAPALASAVLCRYAAFLRGEHHGVPLCPTPVAARDWALQDTARLRATHPGLGYRRCLADLLVGRLLPPDAEPSAHGHASDLTDAPDRPLSPPTPVRLARRPRIRAAAEDEDEADSAPGVWMVQTSEPMEHAEDPFGMNRPVDRCAGEQADGAADSLSELEQARQVRTPGRAREVFCDDDRLPAPDRGAAPPADLTGLLYPEWDCGRQAYLERAVRVRVAAGAEGPAGWVSEALSRHAGLLADIRRRLGMLHRQRPLQRRQPEGDDIDLDALVVARAERLAGRAPPEACYLRRRPAPRRLALLMLIDASGSTDAWVADGARVIDVEKEAALIAAAALDSVGAHFAVHAFSGEGPGEVLVQPVKTFSQPWDDAARRRLSGLEPDRYTRLGAALRHAATLLAREPADRHLLLLLSDGRPNDCDRYAGRYGLEAGAYLPTLFGTGRYTVVRRAPQLPLAFVEWLRRAAREAL